MTAGAFGRETENNDPIVSGEIRAMGIFISGNWKQGA